MSTAVLGRPDIFELLPAYQELGIRHTSCPLIAAKANHGISAIAHYGLGCFSETDIDLAVIQMAGSDYALTKNRVPTIMAAADGGAFDKGSSAFVQDYPAIFDLNYDIRLPVNLLPQVASVYFADPDDKRFASALRQIAVIGSICHTMPDAGFDSTAIRRQDFIRAGVEHGLATLLVEQETVLPGLRDPLSGWIRSQSVKPAVPAQP